MTLIYDHAGVRLYHGDCREIIPTLQEKADLVLTDPPYSERVHVFAKSGSISKSQLEGEFEHINEGEMLEYFLLMSTVARRWVVSFIAWEHAALLYKRPPVGLRFIRFGVWVKNETGPPQFSGDRPAQGWEAIAFLHNAQEKLRWNGKGRSSVFSHTIERLYTNGKWGAHPTVKPLGLVKELMLLFSNNGDVVLDPFAGSGTTGVAAKQLGRRAILIEREEKYCDLIIERLQQEAMLL